MSLSVEQRRYKVYVEGQHVCLTHLMRAARRRVNKNCTNLASEFRYAVLMECVASLYKHIALPYADRDDIEDYDESTMRCVEMPLTDILEITEQCKVLYRDETESLFPLIPNEGIGTVIQKAETNAVHGALVQAQRDISPSTSIHSEVRAWFTRTHILASEPDFSYFDE